LFRYREAYFNVGSRTDSRDTFLCLSKEKYPKEKTPTYRLILRFSFLSRIFRTGFPALRKTRGIPATPLRQFSTKAAMLGRYVRDLKPLAFGNNSLRGFLFFIASSVDAIEVQPAHTCFDYST